MARENQEMPYGVGRLTPGWVLLVVGLLAVIFIGVWAYAQQITEGEIVTGLRDIGTMGGAAWGLYVAFIIYFVGVSFAGITVAALIRLLNLTHLRPLSRIAELLTIVSLILAAFSVIADVGQPLRALLYLPRYARPQSPFFGTFTLVISGYLFASLVYFYLAGRRDAALMAMRDTPLRWFYRLWAGGYQDTPEEQERRNRTSFWLAIAIVPLLITAHSTLGLVFGLQVGRPGWYSALQAPAFVLMAGISGVGLLLVLAAIVRRTLRVEHQLDIAAFRWLGLFLLVMILAYLYFTTVEVLTGFYSGQHHEQVLVQTLLWGEYAGLFWGSVASLAASAGLLLLQAFTRRWNIPLLVVCGILVNFAAIGKRYLIVVPSQVYGPLLPYGVGHYSPSLVEYSIVLGLFALGGLLYTVFMKVFPIMDVEETPAYAFPRVPAAVGVPSPQRIAIPRTATAIAMVIAGFALQMVSYLRLAAPWGFPPSSAAYSEPRVVLAPTVVMLGGHPIGWLTDLVKTLGSPPLLFVFGVVLVFLGAVVYEVFPRRRST